jgi:glycosyltransferase involved in cell wall biosynthesis
LTHSERNTVIVFHPAQQHSYRLALALNKKNLLHAYLTTVYYNPKRTIYKLLGYLLDKKNVKRMEGRRLAHIENKVVQFCESLGLFFLLWSRMDKKYKLTFGLFDFLSNVFGKKVAKYAIKNNARAIIGYDTASLKCFEQISKKSKGMIKILDMSSASGSCIYDIINNDIRRGNPFFASYRQKLRQYSKISCRRFDEEIRLADYFLVASDFVKKSLLALNIPERRIFTVPYGIDRDRFRPKKNYQIDKKLKFLFVGRIEAAKGIYSLLEAFKQLDRKDIELILVGSTCGNDSLLEPYKNFFTNLGTKLNSEMPDIYMGSDVFIIPSMWEGLSLTIFEALATGTPVIASDHSGIVDIIANGEEGFYYEAGNVEQLKNKICWFAENRDKIAIMGAKAAETAAKYTWERYEEGVFNAINKITVLNEEKN